MDIIHAVHSQRFIHFMTLRHQTANAADQVIFEYVLLSNRLLLHLAFGIGDVDQDTRR